MTSQGCLSFMSLSAVDIISWMKNVVFLFLALCHRLELSTSTHNKWTQMVNISTRCCGKMNVSRKCVENVLFPPAVVRTRGTWHVCQCLHIPPITGVSVAADTGKYYSWRDYLESVLSILRWTLATTLCDAPDSELWLPGNTHRIQHKKYFNIKKYLIANVVAGEMTERDWGCDARVPPEVLRSYRHRHHRYRPPTPG